MRAMQIHDRYKGYFFILPAFILLVSILGFSRHRRGSPEL